MSDRRQNDMTDHLGLGEPLLSIQVGDCLVTIRRRIADESLWYAEHCARDDEMIGGSVAEIEQGGVPGYGFSSSRGPGRDENVIYGTLPRGATSADGTDATGRSIPIYIAAGAWVAVAPAETSVTIRLRARPAGKVIWTHHLPAGDATRSPPSTWSVYRDLLRIARNERGRLVQHAREQPRNQPPESPSSIRRRLHGGVRNASRMLGKRGDDPWSIAIDIPEPLQFAGFIGTREGFSFDFDQPTASAAEAEWRTWYQSIPAALLAFSNEIRERHINAPGLPPPRPPSVFLIDPPRFRTIDQWPALQQLCQRHWDEFRVESGPMTERVVELIERQQTSINLGDIVARCRQQAKSRSRFELMLSVVHWPSDLVWQATDDHLILGAAYLEPERTGALREMIQTQILKLIR